MALYDLVKPILFKLDPEVAHNLAFRIGCISQQLPGFTNLLSRYFLVDSAKLEVSLFRQQFRNPVGLAAGFDKNARLLPLLSALGFGFVEVGSVTNQPTGGNPKPRLFRLEEDSALINRMGLNNLGPAEIIARLTSYQLPRDFQTAINIAKTNDDTILGEDAIHDMLNCYRQVNNNSAFVVLNVSCPNSGDGRTFEESNALRALLQAFSTEREPGRKPPSLLVKFSADQTLGTLTSAIEVCEEFKVAGYVLVNTSAARDDLLTSSERLAQIGRGGLSGKPLLDLALERVRHVYSLLEGKKPIVGVGGITSASDAYKFIKAGASLVELYTGLIYKGPSIAKQINQGLLALLEKDGLSEITEAIGIEHREKLAKSSHHRSA